MLGAGIYPITLVEMHSYSEDIDKLFDADEHERLKEFLALNPESGEIVPGTGGVRTLEWPLRECGGGLCARIFYYFRDLNMPLYLLAVYRRGETVDLSGKVRSEMEKLVKELVDQHSKEWARLVGRSDSGAS